MVEMSENAVNKALNYQFPMTMLGLGCITWFCLAMAYTYPLIGANNSKSIPGFSKQIGVTMASAFLGCIALVIGLILLSAQWANVQSTAYLVIIITTVTLGCIAAAMSIAGITH
jgi:hypothetical protein